MVWHTSPSLHGLGLALAVALGLATLAGAPGKAAAADLDDYPASFKDQRFDRYGDRDYDDDGRYRETHLRDACVPREVVRHRLRADGWQDFDLPEPRGAHVVVDARRPNGRLFSLRIDRCSGEVVLARPLEPPRFARWAARDDWRDRGGRHWRRPSGWEYDRPHRY